MELKELKEKFDAIKKVGKPIQVVIDYDGHGQFFTTEKYNGITAKEYLELRDKK